MEARCLPGAVFPLGYFLGRGAALRDEPCLYGIAAPADYNEYGP